MIKWIENKISQKGYLRLLKWIKWYPGWNFNIRKVIGGKIINIMMKLATDIATFSTDREKIKQILLVLTYEGGQAPNWLIKHQQGKTLTKQLIVINGNK